jgi:hypothetical protein
MSYRWIFMASIPRMVRSIITAANAGVQGTYVCIHRRGEAFKRTAMNVSACRFCESEYRICFTNTSNAGNGPTTRRRPNN